MINQNPTLPCMVKSKKNRATVHSSLNINLKHIFLLILMFVFFFFYNKYNN
jgi:hypothetical protein